ncbi:hypothetical protein MHBO_003268 [Bonamia ostreae]|uniref:Uncharacterized protein n=1 Tax=Bonamia ostreae TaxID=126728 RepID=A0ABV2AQ03_9EUKA
MATFSGTLDNTPDNTIEENIKNEKAEISKNFEKSLANNLQNENTKLSKQLELEKQKNKTLNELETKRTTELNEAVARLEKLKEQKERYENTNKQLETQIKSVDVAERKLIQDVETLKQTNEKLEQKINTLEKETREKTVKISELENEFVLLKRILQNVSKKKCEDNKNHTSKQRDLDRKIEELTENLGFANKRIVELEIKLKEKGDFKENEHEMKNVKGEGNIHDIIKSLNEKLKQRQDRNEEHIDLNDLIESQILDDSTKFLAAETAKMDIDRKLKNLDECLYMTRWLRKELRDDQTEGRVQGEIIFYEDGQEAKKPINTENLQNLERSIERDIEEQKNKLEMIEKIKSSIESEKKILYY